MSISFRIYTLSLSKFSTKINVQKCDLKKSINSKDLSCTNEKNDHGFGIKHKFFRFDRSKKKMIGIKKIFM